jgi:cellulose synthase/poly-beta-1,6-N-acetylglucosamine synthase-like glycosyltransferase
MQPIDILFWILYFILLYVTIFSVLTLLDESYVKRRRLKIKKWPSVSIIIPAYNEEKTIAETLKSLVALDYPKNKLEIIAINDGSKDNTKNVIKSFEKYGVKLINQENKGKGAALNNGLKIAKGEFFVCLDADSFVEPKTLKEMIAYFTDKKIAAVTPIMKVKNPKNLLQKIQSLEYILYIYMKKILERLNAINVAPGPFTIYRREVLIKIGGFDQKSIVEDQEIAYRLQKYQYKIVQSEKGNVTTIAPKTLRKLYKQRSRWSRGSLLTLYKYREMIFNKKYGDFGMYNLPSIAFGTSLFFFVIIFFFVYSVVPFIETIRQWSLVNFSISLNMQTLLPDLQNSLVNYLFYTDYAKAFILVSVFLIVLLFMFKAHKETNENMGLKNLIPLTLFFIVYYIVLSFMWLGAMIELAFRKGYKW